MNFDYSLYYVTDQERFNSDKEFYSFVEEVLSGGVTALQLRYKKNLGKEFLRTAINLKKITAKYNIPLIINDRIDIALLANADGVHLGQSDIPIEYAKKLMGENAIIGISANTAEKAIEAEQSGANYIGVGAIFQTTSKDDACVISKNEIKAISESVKVPLVAIGGISEKNITLLPKKVFSGIAVISALQSSEVPKDTAKHLYNLFDNVKK